MKASLVASVEMVANTMVLSTPIIVAANGNKQPMEWKSGGGCAACFVTCDALKINLTRLVPYKICRLNGTGLTCSRITHQSHNLIAPFKCIPSASYCFSSPDSYKWQNGPTLIRAKWGARVLTPDNTNRRTRINPLSPTYTTRFKPLLYIPSDEMAERRSRSASIAVSRKISVVAKVAQAELTPACFTL